MEGRDRIFVQAKSQTRCWNEHRSHPDRIEQAAAICLRAGSKAGDLEVLLITSTSTGRWGLPKGHIEPGETSCQTALREAGEEAGVEGTIAQDAYGYFTHRKTGRRTVYHVAIHLLMVSRQRENFPEISSRYLKWVPLAIAKAEVENLQLSRIIERLSLDYIDKILAI